MIWRNRRKPSTRAMEPERSAASRIERLTEPRKSPAGEPAARAPREAAISQPTVVRPFAWIGVAPSRLPAGRVRPPHSSAESTMTFPWASARIALRSMVVHMSQPIIIGPQLQPCPRIPPVPPGIQEPARQSQSPAVPVRVLRSASTPLQLPL